MDRKTLLEEAIKLASHFEDLAILLPYSDVDSLMAKTLDTYMWWFLKHNTDHYDYTEVIEWCKAELENENSDQALD